MIEGKIVKIRFNKYFPEQRLWIFIGKVLKFTDNWVTVEGRGIITVKGDLPAHIDEEPRLLMIPRENIAHIRILPDTFDLSEIKVETRGFRQYIKVKGGPDTSIGEL